MAQEQIPLFNFYFRYKWNEEDFAEWQEGMVNLERAMMEGLFNGAVMGGFSVDPVSGMLLDVDPGIAIGSSGYLMVENDHTAIPITAPVSNVRKDIIVVRPKLVDSEAITRPTQPFDTVYLKQLQDCEVVLIQGTPSATPAYPAKQTGDIILCGVRTQAGQVTLTSDDVDYEVKEIYGKNSNFQQNFGRYDDRLRPYRSTNNTLGIKPSQLIGPFPRAFTFVDKALPSRFPKDGSGNFNNADTFLNFETGAITGGDAASADFLPTIPSAGNWINATVAINTNDEIQVLYGVQGTRAQCLAGVYNRTTGLGAGSVQMPDNAKVIAIVTVKSPDGSTITELEYNDYRGQAAVAEPANGFAGAGTVACTGNVTLDVTYKAKVLLFDTTSASGTVQLPPPEQNYKFTVKDVKGTFDTNKVRLLRDGSEKIENLAADFDMESAYGEWSWISNGTDWFQL